MLVPPPHSAFTQSQLTALKYQILAYKLISKNMPLPPNLQQVVLAPMNGDETNWNEGNQKLAEGSGNSVASPSGSVQARRSSPAVARSASPQQAQPVPKEPEYNAYASPYNMLKKPITSYAHASRQHRQLMPSITPVGVDSQAVSEERERRITSSIEERIQELENVSDEALRELMSSDNSGKESVDSSIKTLIELKSLKLRDKQKKVKLSAYIVRKSIGLTLSHSCEKSLLVLLLSRLFSLHQLTGWPSGE